MKEIKNIKLVILNGDITLSEEKKEKLRKAFEKMIPELLENINPDWMTMHKRRVLFTREKKISELTKLEETYQAHFSEGCIQINIGWDDVCFRFNGDTVNVFLKTGVIVNLLSNWKDIIKALSDEKKEDIDKEYKIDEAINRFLEN